MGVLGNSIQNIHWGQPAYVLAALSIIILAVFSGKKFRSSPMGIASAIFGGIGFIVAGWLGIFTFSIALSYRLFHKLKAPKQFWVTLFSSFTIFALLSYGILKIDPQAGVERKNGNLGGVFLIMNDSITWLAEHAIDLLLIIFIIIVLVGLFLLRKRIRKNNPYKGYGGKVSADQMYKGLKNPDMKVIPESQRDPVRVFSLSMRKKKLEDQKGMCRYASQSYHPNWEPYREGIQWEGDHIIPHAVGGATNYKNLQMLCADCNSAKSSLMFDKADEAVEKRWKKGSNFTAEK